MKQLKNAVTVEVYYKASEKLQKQLLADGLIGEKIQKVVIETLNPDFFELAKVTDQGRVIINVATNSWNDCKALTGWGGCFLEIPKFVIERRGGEWFDSNVEKVKAVVTEIKHQPEFESIPDEKMLMNLFNPDRKQVEKEAAQKQIELDADFEKRKSTYLLKKAEQEKKRDEERAKQEREQAEKDAIEKAAKAELQAWIEQHGSDRLKMMFERGYEYKLTYEIERGKVELPGFIYDREGEAIQFSERANPSEKALKIESEYIKKYGDGNTNIGWGYCRDYDDEMGWYAQDETQSELIWVRPEWSRQGFALFL